MLYAGDGEQAGLPMFAAVWAQNLLADASAGLAVERLRIQGIHLDARN